MSSQYVAEFTEANWQQDVISASQPVLVDFWAPWCGPCKAIAPELEAVAEAYQGKAKVGKVNLDDNGSLAAQYQIRSIPTLLLINNGQVVDQMVGMANREKIEQMINKAL